jgi:hypothetical protein
VGPGLVGRISITVTGMGFKKRKKFLRPAANLQLLLLIVASHVSLYLNDKLSLVMVPSVLELAPNKYVTIQNMKMGEFLLFYFSHFSEPLSSSPDEEHAVA